MKLSRLIDSVDEEGFLEMVICDDPSTTDPSVIFKDFSSIESYNYQTLAVQIETSVLTGQKICYFKGDEVISIKKIASFLTEEDWLFFERELIFDIFCLRQDETYKLQSLNIDVKSQNDGLEFSSDWKTKSLYERLESIDSLDYLTHRSLKKLIQPYRESVILYEKNKSIHNPKR